jgi:hypothetical protein
VNRKGLAGGTPEQIGAVGAVSSYIWFPAKDRERLSYQHVPMVKNAMPSLDAVTKLADCPYWLFFNEPNFYSGDGYLRPADAAKLYHDASMLIRSVRPDARFIVGGLFWPQNLTWLEMFREAYAVAYGSYPVVHGWHVHNYAEVDKYTQQQWRDLLLPMQRWIANLGGEFWLSEFGCLQSDAVAKRVMVEQCPWLEAQPWVTRYFWWTSYSAVRKGSLFTTETGTQRTELGALYAAVGPTQPTPPPTWTPPAFVNGLRRYNDPTIKDGCPAVLEFGHNNSVVQRIACRLPGGDHLWHFRDGEIAVEWQDA